MSADDTGVLATEVGPGDMITPNVAVTPWIMGLADGVPGGRVRWLAGDPGIVIMRSDSDLVGPKTTAWTMVAVGMTIVSCWVGLGDLRMVMTHRNEDR